MESAVYRRAQRQVFEFKRFRCSVFDFKGLSGKISVASALGGLESLYFRFYLGESQAKTCREVRKL
jgi:hypothetical protein